MEIEFLEDDEEKMKKWIIENLEEIVFAIITQQPIKTQEQMSKELKDLNIKFKLCQKN